MAKEVHLTATRLGKPALKTPLLSLQVVVQVVLVGLLCGIHFLKSIIDASPLPT